MALSPQIRDFFHNNYIIKSYNNYMDGKERSKLYEQNEKTIEACIQQCKENNNQTTENPYISNIY
ncbi:hypothetical protein FACS1894176_07940 [Bacteroidia bacterium]|nr:hypothetical protein FACS1894176_07940 [Bacteroidia bacterium]